MIFDCFYKIGLIHYLILATVLFFIGLFGVIVSRNIIKILICIELMLNAVSINFVAFAAYSDAIKVSGMIFALFITAVSAAQVAIGIAILLFIYRQKHTVDSEKVGDLKG